MVSLATSASAACLVFVSIVQLLWRYVRFSQWMVDLCRFGRDRHLLPAWLLPDVLHPDEITSSALSAILRRRVVIVGQERLGDGKMSSIRKISYVEMDSCSRRDRVQTRHLVCKSSPSTFGEALMATIYNLHRREIAGLRHGRRLSPALLYVGVHWTGQYVLLMEFVPGRSPTVAAGIDCVPEIDTFVVDLARFHRDSLHFGIDHDPDWKRLAFGGASGPVSSVLQRLVFGKIWQQTGGQYNPPAIEARRPLVEFGLQNLVELQLRALRRYPTVLAHGDLHCANFVLADDDRLRLVDWQASCVRPLFYDLCYFLGTSVPIELRRQHLDRWLDLYLNEIGLNHVPKEIVQECFAVCLYSLLVPLQFMAFLIKNDRDNGYMYFEASGRRALTLIEDYDTEAQLHALLDRAQAKDAEMLSVWQNRK